MLQDENTRYVCIGPVNKAINMLCCWLEDPESEAFKRSALLLHIKLLLILPALLVTSDG